MPDDLTPSSAGRARPGPSPRKAAGFAGALLMSLLGILPFLFGIGFLAPLIAQLLERALPAAAQAQWPLLVGLAIGGSWGALANLRGRWL